MKQKGCIYLFNNYLKHSFNRVSLDLNKVNTLSCDGKLVIDHFMSKNSSSRNIINLNFYLFLQAFDIKGAFGRIGVNLNKT